MPMNDIDLMTKSLEGTDEPQQQNQQPVEPPEPSGDGNEPVEPQGDQNSQDDQGNQSDQNSQVDQDSQIDQDKDVPQGEPSQDINSLMAKITELEARIKTLSQPQPQPRQEPSSEIAPQDFISDIDPDSFDPTDPKHLNGLLNKVYAKAIVDAQENILRSVPDVVKNSLATTMSLQKAADDFYSSNSDLKPFKRVVAAVFEELASENPGTDYKTLMSTTAEETRKRLGLHKQALSQPTSRPPRLHEPRSSGRPTSPKPAPNPLAEQIEAMNKALGGI